MLVIAVALLVFDALATYVLCARRRRARRRESEARSMPRPQEVTSAADRLNDDLASRQAILLARSQQPESPAIDRSAHEQAVAVPRGVIPPLFEIRRAAERLSATSVLVYDPTVWEA